MKKNNLDEMQEQKLLKIEQNAYWLCFTGLLVAIAVQMILSADWRLVAGEWIVFMLANVYVMIACVRAGIWDRRLKMDVKTNLLVSLTAALLFGALTFAASLVRYHKPQGSLAGAGISAVCCFVLCFAALQLSAHAVKKRQEALNAEPEDQ